MPPPTWEDADPPPRQTLGGAATRNEALLIPLAQAQDAVARLEASVAAAPDDVATGLRARLALFEAAGFLAHCGPAVHPHDLALRDANITGSYTLAALTGRLREAAPWSTAADGADPDARRRPLGRARTGLRPALAASRRTRDRAAPSICGGSGGVARPVRRATCRRGSDARLARLATRAERVSGPARRRPRHGGRAARDRAGRPARARSCLRRRRAVVPSRLRPGLRLPFWAAPVSRIDALARQGGGEFALSYLDCLAEAARRGARELARLQEAARRIATLPARGRSRLHAAGAVALREPLVTGRLLAQRLDVSPRAGLDLATGLVAAGVLREMTGRPRGRSPWLEPTPQSEE